MVDVALLEHAVREDLNRRAPRVMGVLDPLRVVIENYPEGESEQFEVANNPEDDAAGTRQVPFSRVLYIERDDFMEDPPKKFFRLRRAAKCGCAAPTSSPARTSSRTSGRGRRAALHDRSGDARRRRGRRPQGEGHAALGLGRARDRRRGRLYDRLFKSENPDGDRGQLPRRLNPHSLEVLATAGSSRASPARAGNALPVRAPRLLLRRPRLHSRTLVFNRTVTLKDTWARIEQRG